MTAVWAIITAGVCGALAAGGWWLFRRWLERRVAQALQQALQRVQQLSYDEGHRKGWAKALEQKSRDHCRLELQDSIKRRTSELYIKIVSHYSSNNAHRLSEAQHLKVMQSLVDEFSDSMLRYFTKAEMEAEA